MTTVSVRKRKEYSGHRDAIYTLCPAIRPGHFLTCGAEGIVAEWELGNEDAKAWVQAPTSVYSMLLLPEHGLLLLGQSDGSLLFVDLKTQKPIKSVKAHEKGIFDLYLLPSGKLVSSGNDGLLAIWELEKMSLLSRKQISGKSIRTLSEGPSKEYLLAGSSEGNVLLLNENLDILHNWKANEPSVFRVKWSESAQKVYSVGRDAHIRAWDAKKDFAESAAVPAHMYAINDLVFHPEKPFFFTGSMDKSIKLWERDSLKLCKVADWPKNQVHRNGVNRLLWMEDRLLSVGDDKLIMEWEWDF